MRFAVHTIVLVSMLFATGDKGYAEYMSLYGDEAGTSACAQIEPTQYTVLPLFAVRGPDTRGSLSGAEFRIEVSDPDGWSFVYQPPTGAIRIGDPLDLAPEDDNESGVTLAFTTCQEWDEQGRVSLGSILAYNINGNPTELLVKRRVDASTSHYSCALLIDCHEPYFTKRCATPRLPDGCSQTQEASSRRWCDPVYSVLALNQQPDPQWSTPEVEVAPGDQVIAMLTRRNWITLPDEAHVARLEDAIITSGGLARVLQEGSVDFVGKALPCFDLADTVWVNPQGEPVPMTDWSLFWVFSVAPSVSRLPLLEALESLPEVVYAELNGGIRNDDLIGPGSVSFHADNPFRSSGTLRVQASRAVTGSMVIYDATGRRVRNLMSGWFQEGPNEFLWDGRNDHGKKLANGVYFVRLTSRGTGSTHKLVLIR